MLYPDWIPQLYTFAFLIQFALLFPQVTCYRSRLKGGKHGRSLFQQVSPYVQDRRTANGAVSSVARPTFDQSVPSQLYVPLDHIAYLHCKVQNQADYQVAWVRQSDGHLLYTGEEAFTNDQRFSISFREESNDWCLVIRSCSHNDSGQYECQLSTEPLQRFVVTLNVIDEPQAILPATVLQAIQIQSDKENDALIRGTEAVQGGEDINVECEVIAKTHIQQLPEYVEWRLNDTLLDTHNKTRYKIDRHRRANKLVHTLKVFQATNRDTGKYTCVADNTPSKSMLIQVNDSSSPFTSKTDLFSVMLSLVIVMYIR